MHCKSVPISDEGVQGPSNISSRPPSPSRSLLEPPDPERGSYFSIRRWKRSPFARSVGCALFIKSKINCIQFQRLASQPWPGLIVHFHFEAYESFYFVLRLSIESESKVLRNRQTMHRISTISDQRHKRRLCPFVAGCNKYSSLCKTSSSGLSAPGKTRLDRERAKMCIAEIVSGIKKDSSQLPWRSERLVSLRPTFSVRGAIHK